MIHLISSAITSRCESRSIVAGKVAHECGFQSIAFPLIGAGSGSFNHEKSKELMLDELSKLDVKMTVKIVVFKKAKR